MRQDPSDDDWHADDEHAVGGYAEDEDFDYEEYIEREFPEDVDVPSAVNWKQWIWRVVIVVVCLLLIWRFLLY